MEAFYFTPILLFLVERGAEKERERERGSCSKEYYRKRCL